MNKAAMHDITARWTRVGGLFGTPAAKESPDLERLLLDTARLIPDNAKLLAVGASWLARYSIFIVRDRLALLVAQELEPEHRPTMGLFLDIAGRWAKTSHFAKAIKLCNPAVDPGPLFNVMRRNRKTWALAERWASDESNKWGRWAQTVAIKNDALMAPKGVLAQNPSYRFRATLKGDARAAVIVALSHDEVAAASIMALAGAAGIARPTAYDAIRDLELSGDVDRDASGGVRLTPQARRVA